MEHEKFWQDIKKDLETNPNRFIANGMSYSIGAYEPNDKFRGHGGRKFYVHFNDGRVVETENLWTNGSIPEEFKSELPDTAILERS